MNYRQRLVVLLRQLVPTRYRRGVKQLVERYSNTACRSFYADYGEDAFLQSYFRQQSFEAHSDLPMHLLKDAVGSGFYVDIGAYSPKLFSSTYWFYRRGWSGINVDATPGSMELFRKVRPRDVNIEAAISNQEGNITLFCWDSPSPMNTVSPEHAARLANESGKSPRQELVSTVKLSTLLDFHLPSNQAISFLTVDVEHHDLQVLKSNDWNRYRPEILLVENHLSHVSEVVDSEITRFLQAVDYEIYAWIKPTVVYRRANSWDPLVY